MLLVATFAVAIPVPVAAAPADPDSITLHTAKVFQNIFEADDILLVVSYDVDYAVEPDESAADTFQLTIYDTDGTTEIQTRALNYYQYNVHSIYFDAAAAASLVWETEYVVRVMGNPIFFAPVEDTTMDSKTLASTDWLSGTMSASRELLRIHCIDLAETLEEEWSLTLIVISASDQVLNSVGRTTFLDAIPSLDSAVTALFQMASSSITVTQRTQVATYEEELTIANKLGATINTAFSGIGTNILNISGQKVALLWILLVILTIASIVFLNSGNTTGAMILSLPAVLMGALVGAIPLAALFVATAIVVIYMGYHIWLRGL